MKKNKRVKDPRPMKCVWRTGSTSNGRSEMPDRCKDMGCKGEFTSKRKALIWKKAHEKCRFSEDGNDG